MYQQDRWMRQYWLTTKKYRREPTSGADSNLHRQGMVLTERNRIYDHGIWQDQGVQRIDTQEYNRETIIRFQLQGVQQGKTFQALRGQEKQRCAGHATVRKRKPEDRLERTEKLQLGKSVQESQARIWRMKGKTSVHDLNNRKSETKRIRIRLRQIGT